MKYGLIAKMLTSLTVAIALTGCQNEGAQLTAPDVGASDTPQLLEMPAGDALLRGVSTRGTIERSRGGKIELKYEEKVAKDKFKLEVELKFEKESITNDFEASLSMDAQYLMNNVALEFGPHGTYFLQPANLSIRVEGMDLSAFPEGTVLHLYYNNNGRWEKMAGTVKFDKKNGKIECKDGKLPHFSRYAFGI